MTTNMKNEIWKDIPGYEGVSWYRYTQKWASKIRINGKGFHLGYFKCELAAYLAYQNKLKELSK